MLQASVGSKPLLQLDMVSSEAVPKPHSEGTEFWQRGTDFTGISGPQVVLKVGTVLEMQAFPSSNVVLCS